MISAIGMALIDTILSVDGFNDREGSYHSDSLIVAGGGMAATAMCAAARLGAESRIFSCVGDDLFGSFMRNDLRDHGVDTAGITVVPGAASTVGIVLVDENTGEKQFYSELVKKVFYGPRSLDLSLLEGTDVLLVDGHWRRGALDGAHWAKDHDIPVVADFKRTYDGLDSLWPYIDYCILPYFYASELTGLTEPVEMLNALAGMQPGKPVITKGAEGGWYLEKGGMETYPVFPVEAVDSTGAGDAFHGAFCYFLSRGMSFRDCLTLSSAVGALNCRGRGGRSSLPDSDELAHFIHASGYDIRIP